MRPLIDQVIENNLDTVKVVFKHFPLSMHKQAKPAAYASIAADNQGKFWEYHDELFLNIKKLNDTNTLMEIATKMGLDMAQFSKDMVDPRTKNKVEQDIRDGAQVGVTGTPTIFINGRKLKQRSAADAQKIIDDELKKLKSGK
jgi:protein-disulfide isomerase